MKRFLPWTLALLALTFGTSGIVKAQTGVEAEFEKKRVETDFTNPDALFELANWAIANKESDKVRAEGRKLMKEVIELDTDHEGARAALGYVRYNDKWLTKKEFEDARNKDMAADMKAKGYVPFKNGWIKAADKSKWNSRWEKNDDGIWLSFDEVQQAKGLVKYDGVWLKLGDAERQRMEKHRKATGDDILVVSTPHFLLHMGIKASLMEKYVKQAEEVYAWYCEAFKLAQPFEEQLWPGQVHIWHFETEQHFQDWVTTYSEEYQFTDEDKKRFREHPSGYLISGKRIITVVAQKAEDIENPMVHQIGTMLHDWHSRGMSVAWMREAYGHLAEHLLTGDKYGHTNCTTNSRYGGQGDVAAKEFNTRDGQPRCKSIVKAGDELPITELSKLGLNSLNGDHLAQGFSIIDWLYQANRERMIAMQNVQRAFRFQEDPGDKGGAILIETMITEGYKAAVKEFESTWRDWVKKNYK